MIYMTKPERKQEKTHNLCFQGSSDCSLVFSLCIVFFLHNWFLFFLGCHQSHNAVCTTGKILKCLFPALARVTQEVGASFHAAKGCRFSPDQGTFLGWGADPRSRRGHLRPQSRHIREAARPFFSLASMFLFLPLSLPLPKRNNRKCPQVRIQK